MARRTNPEVKTPEKEPTKLGRLIALFKECFFSVFSPSKPILVFIKKEGKGMKAGWHLFTVIALVLMSGTWWGTRAWDTSRESEGVKLSPHEWPSLTDQQVAVWVSQLAPLQIESIIVYREPEVECQKLYRSLQSVAKGLNCKIGSTTGSPQFNGILIVGSEKQGRPLLKLFQGLKCPTVLQVFGDNDIQIFIGDKP